MRNNFWKRGLSLLLAAAAAFLSFPIGAAQGEKIPFGAEDITSALSEDIFSSGVLFDSEEKTGTDGDASFADRITLTADSLRFGILKEKAEGLRFLTLASLDGHAPGYFFGAETYGGNVSYVPETLETLTIESGSVPKNSLFGIDGISELVLPALPDGGYLSAAFGGESYMENVVPSSIKTLTIKGGVIGRNAFYGCTGIEKIILGDGVAVLEGGAFTGCDGLKEIVLGSAISALPDSAFENAMSLTSVSAAGKVKTIGARAFYGCTELESIETDGVETIGTRAFFGCTGMKEIFLSENIANIGEFAFSDCFGMHIYCAFEEENIPSGWKKNWHDDSVTVEYGCEEISEDISLLEEKEAKFVFTPAADGYAVSLDKNEQYVGELEIPAYHNGEKVTQIGSSAFAGQTEITSVAFESESFLTEIGSDAFNGCTSLVGVKIPKRTVSVGDNAFMNCKSLESIVIPKSVLSIGDSAFYGCDRLNTVTFEDRTVLSVGKNAFYGCGALRNVFSSDVSEWLKITFENEYANPLYYAKKLRIGNESEYAELTSLSVDGRIPAYSFFACRTIEKIDLEKVTDIGEYAFFGCERLRTVTNAPSGIGCGSESMGYVAYNADIVLHTDGAEISDPSQTVVRDEDGFLFTVSENSDGTENFELIAYVGNQKSIVLPESYGEDPYTIGNLILPEVTEITVPYGVTHIPDEAFRNNERLEKIILPASLLSIGRNILCGCGEVTIEYKDDRAAFRFLKKASDWAANCVIKELLYARDRGILWESKDFSDFAISGCDANQRELYIPTAFSGRKVTRVADKAFAGHTQLKEVRFPDAVPTGFLGFMIFDGCTGIEKIDLADGSCLDGNDRYYIIDQSEGETRKIAVHSSLFGIPKNNASLKQYVFSAEEADGSRKERTSSEDRRYSAADGVLYKNAVLSDTLSVPVAVLDAPVKIARSNLDLPNTVVKISPYAFAYNRTLKSIRLPYVSMVGRSAFLQATSLESVLFGSDKNDEPPAEIADAIQKDDSLKRNTVIRITSDGTEEEYTYQTEEAYYQYIDEQAFMGCTALRSVNLDSETIVGIKSAAFEGCGAIESLSLGKNIRVLGKYGEDDRLVDEYSVFSGMTSLEMITVAEENPIFRAKDNVLYEKTERDGAEFLTLIFYPAAAVKTDEKGDTLLDENGQKVRRSAFSVPENTVGIKPRAFAGTRYLTELDVSPSVICETGSEAFCGSNIHTLKIGRNVHSLASEKGSEYTSFSDCPMLASIAVEEENPSYRTVDGVLFDKAEQSTLIKYPAQKMGAAYSVPTAVLSIAPEAFAGNRQLSFVTVNSALRKVGDKAFYECSGLKTVFFDRVAAPTEVGASAFVTIPDTASRTQYATLGYSAEYSSSWMEFSEKYPYIPTSMYGRIPDLSVYGESDEDDYYSIVLIDSDGNIVENSCMVSLTGKLPILSETENGETNWESVGETKRVENGIVTFYNLAGNTEEGLGLSLYYDNPYTLSIADEDGEYYLYENELFYLDSEMHISYITLSRRPSNAYFDLNGGSIEAGAESLFDDFAVKKGAEYVLPTYSMLKRPGYTLNGWQTTLTNGETREYRYEKDSDGNYRADSAAVFSHKEYQSAFILKAMWTANTNTLLVYRNDPEKDDFSECERVEIKTDESRSLAEFYEARAGYTFVGWAREQDGKPVYSGDEVFVCGPESEYRVYGKWVANTNVVIFNANGGSGTVDEIVLQTGEKTTLPHDGFEREGYTLDGWHDGAGESYGLGAEYLCSTDSVQILYATWKANPSHIILHENISAAEDKKTVVTKRADGTELCTDDRFSLRDCSDAFSRAGYELIGWQTKESGRNAYYSAEDTYTMPTGSADFYAVWTKVAEAYGMMLGQTDINTRTADLNKAQYGYLDEKETISETLELTVSGYCDASRGWSFTGGALYQNGIKICDRTAFSAAAGENGRTATVFVFDLPVKELQNETEIEARLELSKTVNGKTRRIFCTTALNIHVFEFLLTSENVKLNTNALDLDLSKAGEVFSKLFGSKKSIKLGENANFNVEVNDSEVTLSLDADREGSKTTSSKPLTYKEGYFHAEGARAHNKNTYFFQFKSLLKDGGGNTHNLTYNVRFARDHEKENYFYYSCYIYEDTYENEIQRFFGAVNCKNAVMKGRAGLTAKAVMIHVKHLTAAQEKIRNISDKNAAVSALKKLGEEARYTEIAEKTTVKKTSNALSASLSGQLTFQYDRNTFLRFSSGQISGTLKYSFSHNSQFVVWIIPVTLEVSVDMSGSVVLELVADQSKKLSFNAKMTLEAAIAAKLGVGCKVASVGVKGGVGAIFILDFAPRFGVEKLSVTANLGAYVKVFRWKKDIPLYEGKWTIIDNTATLNLLEDIDTAVLFDVSEYENITPEQTTETAKLYSLGKEGQIKLYYLDASEYFAERYDQSNFHKIAVSYREDGTREWSEPVLLEDNLLNDMAFEAAADGENLQVIYTQEGKVCDPSEEDIYAAASDVVIAHKTISLCENGILLSESKTIRSDVFDAEGEKSSLPYAYLPQIAATPSGITAVWAENKDNNILGVSPYNTSSEANGTSYTFTTKANSVWKSIYSESEEKWSEPIPTAESLSAVTALCVDPNGNIAYITDENGDLSDAQDRVLYYNGTAVNDTSVGSVSTVGRYGAGFAYFFEYVKADGEENEQDRSGLYRLIGTEHAKNEFLSENSALSESFCTVRDTNGDAAGIVYAQNVAWRESDEENASIGSGIYGLFRSEDGTFGLPITLVEPQKERYFNSLSVVSDANGVYLTYDVTDAGNAYAGSETQYRVYGTKLLLDSYSTDKKSGTVTMRIRNNGTRSSEVFVSENGGEKQLLLENIACGDVGFAEYTPSRASEAVLRLYDSENGQPFGEIDGLDGKYSDIAVFGRVIVTGAVNQLLVAVKNNGTESSGSFRLQAMKNEEEDSAGIKWTAEVKSVPAGGIRYFEAPIDDIMEQTEGVLTLIADISDDYPDNNIFRLSYKHTTGTSEALKQYDLSELVRTCELSETHAEFENNDIVLTYYAPDGVDIERTEGIESTVDPTDNIVTFKAEKLKTLARGKETIVTVRFTDGTEKPLTIYVPIYYTVTFESEGRTLQTERVRAGDLPTLPESPEKEESTEYVYTFGGWIGEDEGDAAVHAAYEDCTYNAVFNRAKKQYTVTWNLFETENEPILLKQECEYGTVPSYPCEKIPAPEGKHFVRWDKTPTAVTGDAVYNAIYADDFSEDDPLLWTQKVTYDADSARIVADILFDSALRQKVTAVLRIADENGRLEDVRTEEIGEGTEKAELSVSLAKDEKTHDVRIFFLKDLSTLRPLSETKKAEIKASNGQFTSDTVIGGNGNSGTFTPVTPYLFVTVRNDETDSTGNVYMYADGQLAVVPQLEGYDFCGAFRKVNNNKTRAAYGTDPVIDADGRILAELKEDTPIIALWKPSVFAVTLDKANGEEKERIYFLYGEGFFTDLQCRNSVEILPVPESEGYVFDGYTDENSFVTDRNGILLPDRTAVTKNTEWKAQWHGAEYRFIFDANGGTFGVGENDRTERIFSGDMTEFEVPSVSRVGYTLDGWYTEKIGGVPAGASDRIIGNCLFFAHWSPISYTVIFDGNKPENVGDERNVSDFENVFEWTYDQTVESLPEPKLEGWSFKGWYSDTGEAVLPKPNLSTINGDRVTVYASWEPETYTIRFDGNGAEGEMSDIKFRNDTEETLPSNGFSKTGYTFIGWSLKKDGEKAYENGGTICSYVPAGSMVLYAVWRSNTYKVRYEANKPQAASGEVTVFTDEDTWIYGKPNTLAEVPKLENWKFAGWYTSKDCKISEKVGDGGQTVVKNLTEISDGEVTLYAGWQADKIKVKANAAKPQNATHFCGWQGAEENKSFEIIWVVHKDAEWRLPAEPQLVGWSFEGWYIGDECGEACGEKFGEAGEKIEDHNRVTNTDTVKLHAHWKPVAYTVEYKESVPENASSAPTDMPRVKTNEWIYDSEEKVILASAPNLKGWTFEGWYVESSGDFLGMGEKELEKPNLSEMNGATVYVIPKWKAISGKVVYDIAKPSEASGTVAFDIPENLSYTYDSLLQLASAPVLTGWKFLGWYSKDGVRRGGANDMIKVSDMPFDADGTLCLQAMWEEEKYKILFRQSDTGLLRGVEASGTYTEHNLTIRYDAAAKSYAFENTGSADPYATIGQTVYLEAGKRYYVHMKISGYCKSSVQMFYAIDRAYSEAQSKRFADDSEQSFVANKSGLYNIRFDNDTGNAITVTEFYISTVPYRTEADVPYDGELPLLPENAKPNSLYRRFLGYKDTSGNVYYNADGSRALTKFNLADRDIELVAQHEAVTVFTDMTKTPQISRSSCSTRVAVLDYSCYGSGEHDYVKAVMSSGTRYGGGNTNQDLNGVEEVYFIGNPKAIYTNFHPYVVGYAKDSPLTIHMIDFNYRSNDEALSSWYGNAKQDVGVKLTIDVSGSCSMQASTGKDGIVINNVIFTGDGLLTVRGGDGAEGATGDAGKIGGTGGTGGTGINSDCISVNMTGNGKLTVRGGDGGTGGRGGNGKDGPNGQITDRKDKNRNFGSKGETGGKGGHGGAPGIAIRSGCKINIGTLSRLVLKKSRYGNGGQGGDGGNGGKGGHYFNILGSVWNCKGGDGGDSGDGGDGNKGGSPGNVGKKGAWGTGSKNGVGSTFYNPEEKDSADNAPIDGTSGVSGSEVPAPDSGSYTVNGQKKTLSFVN